MSGGTLYAAQSGQMPREASSATGAKSNQHPPAQSSGAKSADKNGQREQGLFIAQPKGGDSTRRQFLRGVSRRAPARPVEHPLVGTRMTAENGQDSQESRPLQSANAQKGPPLQIAAPNAGPATRSFHAIRPNTQILGAVPHRGANPPTISGAATVHRLNSAEINGALVYRKP